MFASRTFRGIGNFAVDPDGQLVEIDPNEESPGSGPPVELSQTGLETEVCLDDGTCIRIVDERQIIESADGWDTATEVWSFSPSDTWLRHEYHDGYNPMVLGLYDIVVLPDQTVAVAPGLFPVIKRSVDGEWTPTVAELRTLPTAALGLAIVAAFVVVVAGFGFGARHGGTGAARNALRVSVIPFVVLARAMLFRGSSQGLGLLVYATLPLVIASVGLFVGSILRARANQDSVTSRALRAGGSAAVAFVCWISVYALWATGLIDWKYALRFWVISFAVAVVVACWQSKTEWRERLPAPRERFSDAVAACGILSYPFGLGVVVLLAAEPPGGAILRTVQLALLQLVWLGAAIGLMARFTLSVKAEPRRKRARTLRRVVAEPAVDAPTAQLVENAEETAGR